MRILWVALLLATPLPLPAAADEAPYGCAALTGRADMTLHVAEHRKTEAGTRYCYARGSGPRAIAFHVALPEAAAWNGRLVYLGDGGADGDLDDAPYLIDGGYAFVNSNMGHDDGVEGRAFGFHDLESEIDFAWRAQHLSLKVAKRLVLAYYERAQHHTYHLGCSTGGRQGLLAAQILPDDYDGIVAGAPGHRWYPRMAHRVALEQRLFAEEFAGNLAVDADGDGIPEDLSRVALLEERVLERCDAADGIGDGIVEPPRCDFDPAVDLAADQYGEPGADEVCFTDAQLETIEQLYDGSRFSDGTIVYPGAPIGSEARWPTVFLPHAGNGLNPYALYSAANVIGYQFYADDPGYLPEDLSNTTLDPDAGSLLPEWAWWRFDIDDLRTAEKTPVYDLMEGDDPNLSRFLERRGGKLLMFHGWADAIIPPQPTIEYFDAVIDGTFGGDAEQAADALRLYMVPGMAHCRGGPGPQLRYQDWLEVLVGWVEQGLVPDFLIGRRPYGEPVNERRICPYPQRAEFVGPAEVASDPQSWRVENFACR